MTSVSVSSRLVLEEMEAKLWKSMVNATCINSVRVLRAFQKDLYDSLVLLGQLGVAQVKTCAERKRKMAKCAQEALDTELICNGKPYLVLVLLEKIAVPVQMDRDDMCDYERFTARVKERVPLYDIELDYGWQHWETCRNQKNFFTISV